MAAAAAVIRLTCFAEDCGKAVQSVIQLGNGQFSELFIQSDHGGPPQYPLWEEKQRDQLAEAGIPVTFCTEFPSRVRPETVWILEIPPHARVRARDMDQFRTTMEHGYQRKTHFSIGTDTVLPLRFSFQGLLDWFLYGFVALIGLLDFYWWLWEFGRYHRDQDLNARFVVQHGPHRFVPHIGWFRRFYNPQMDFRRGSAMGNTRVKPMGMTGWELVQWTIYRHRHLKFFGLWWLWIGSGLFMGVIPLFRYDFKLVQIGVLLYWIIHGVMGLLGLLLTSRLTGGGYSYRGQTVHLCFLLPLYWVALLPLVFLTRVLPPRVSRKRKIK